MSGTDHSGKPFDDSLPNLEGGATGGDASESQNGPVPQGDSSPPMPGEQTVISQKPHLAPTASSPAAARLDPDRLGPGDHLGHYELIEFVGGGGMGRVFRALDKKLDRHVAVKVLPRSQAADPDTLQRFRNEAKSAARLDHDNIARAYDIGEDRGLSYLVFEFVEGLTIRELVDRQGPMSLADSLSYTLQGGRRLGTRGWPWNSSSRR